MNVFKNGHDVPYMYGDDILTNEKITYTVQQMTYTALQRAAASFLLTASAIGKTPKEMMDILEADDVPLSVKYTPELDLIGGADETVYKRRNQWGS